MLLTNPRAHCRPVQHRIHLKPDTAKCVLHNIQGDRVNRGCPIITTLTRRRWRWRWGHGTEADHNYTNLIYGGLTVSRDECGGVHLGDDGGTVHHITGTELGPIVDRSHAVATLHVHTALTDSSTAGIWTTAWHPYCIHRTRLRLHYCTQLDKFMVFVEREMELTMVLAVKVLGKPAKKKE